MRVRHVAALALACLPLAGQQSSVKEATLGKRLAAEFRQRTTPIDSPPVQNYVAGLGQRLAAQMPGAMLPFTFSVIVDDLCRPMHEPAALPGGYVFVPAALLLTAQDEGELAGMLAHAMGHIEQRHGNRQVTQGMLMNVAPMPITFAASCGGESGQAVPQTIAASERQIELEADRLAVQAMADAGFDPKVLLRYIRRVQPDDAALSKVSYEAPAVLPRARRIAALEQAVGKLPARRFSSGASLGPMQEEVRRVLPPAALPKDDAPTLRSGGR